MCTAESSGSSTRRCCPRQSESASSGRSARDVDSSRSSTAPPCSTNRPQRSLCGACPSLLSKGAPRPVILVCFSPCLAAMLHANLGPGDVDLNDPQTLDFYTELAMFKRDETREILVFPPAIAPEHRRSIHI